jgi:hypothetical protein
MHRRRRSVPNGCGSPAVFRRNRGVRACILRRFRYHALLVSAGKVGGGFRIFGEMETMMNVRAGKVREKRERERERERARERERDRERVCVRR